MTRLSRASGITSIRGGKICKAFSPPLNTTKLCLSKSLSSKMVPEVEAFYSCLSSTSAALPLYSW